jgi:hypothetical protein
MFFSTPVEILVPGIDNFAALYFVASDIIRARLEFLHVPQSGRPGNLGKASPATQGTCSIPSLRHQSINAIARAERTSIPSADLGHGEGRTGAVGPLLKAELIGIHSTIPYISSF